MYIRRKVFSVAYDEDTGEEKLFSTTEIMSEESHLERIYSEKSEKDTKAEKAKTAGKVMAGTGAGVYIGARALADKTKKDFVKWTEDAIKGGGGVTNDSSYMKFNSKEDADRAAKYIKKAERTIKSANIAKNVGIALGAAGAGTYLYGRHKSKKTKKD